MRTLVEMRFGSHLYGTATPASDTDIKAVHVPAGRDILLLRAAPVISRKTKTDGTTKNTADDIDYESYALHKYLALVAEGQTVALDMLFAPDFALTAPPDPLWREIQANRGKLLCRRYASFLGYVRQQAAKYGIKGSRMAAVRAIVQALKVAMACYGAQAKLGCLAAEIERFVHEHDHAELVDKPSPGDRIVRHLMVCNRMAPYTQTLKETHRVYKALFDEYGQRALAAERNEGIDWKALSHAVRVGRQALELLATGHVTFPRPEAERLRAIKRGALPYREVAEEIERLLGEVEAAAAVSPLPDQPDRAFIDDLIVAAYGAAAQSRRTA